MAELYVKYSGETAKKYAFGDEWVAQALYMDDIQFDTPEEAKAWWYENYGGKKTNANRIRAMSDEELATWLGDMLGVYPFGTEQWSRERWIDWLKADAEEPQEQRCKFCGGKLSDVRTFGDKKVRHCYSCHFDYEVEE